MEKLNRDRTQMRRAFTKAANEAKCLIEKENKQNSEVRKILDILEDKANRMFKMDEEIKEIYLSEDPFDENAFEREFDSAETYRNNWISIKNNCEDILNRLPSLPNDVDQDANKDVKVPKIDESATNVVSEETEILTSQEKSGTFLQTLIVKVKAKNNSYKLARLLMDTGSQRSYITKDGVAKLGIQKTCQESLSQSLFGGAKTKVQKHGVYDVTLLSCDNSFEIKVTMLDQDRICNFVPKLSKEHLSSLELGNIRLSDAEYDIPEVKILLGADVLVPDEDVYKEKRKTVVVQLSCEEENFTTKLLYFSQYMKMVRMISWMQRFVYNSLHCSKKMRGELTLEEVQEAEGKLFRCIQKECFQNEGAKVLEKMQTFKDDKGTIRIRTKLLHGDETNEFKFPVVLPGKHTIVRRMVYHEHCLLQHAGSGILISNLRERFWIIGLRRVAKSVISHCVICKRFKSNPVEPPFSPFPNDRIKNAAVFE
ncbi:hypothetical protein JTE90_015534, partial [Oedothorax gibbosus]